MLIVSSLMAQDGMVAYYSFDACDLSDMAGIGPDASASQSLVCECGVISSGLEFGTGLDSVIFDNSLTTIFSSDFTLSFYVQLDNPADRVDIFSALPESCMIDSSFAIRYNNLTEQFTAEIGERLENLIELEADIDLSVCWHHIIFSKQEDDYFLYYNGALADEQRATRSLTIDPAYNLAISSSACSGVIDNPFTGIIDEIKIFDRFLTPIEISQLSEFPDQIINRDTTLFLGDGIQIVTGESCSPSPSWSPVSGVDDSSILDPFISPTESTTYTLDLPGAGCSTSDTIRINVIDPDELDCENLLLPNAFTPNGDNLNDNFGIANEFIIESLDKFEIYDRWGERVFSTTDKNEKWDATFKGREVNPAMFLYVVAYTCRGESFVISGNVSVLR
jgi:gliding motility-associated-like protein